MTVRPPLPVDAAPEPENPRAHIDAWVPRKTSDELERDDVVGDDEPLKEYFERMRERGLLD